MKVLFISSGVQTKGLCPIVKAQGKSLEENGLSLDYFIISEGGLRGYFKSVLKLRLLLKSSKYDILHAHYGLCGIVALLAKRKEKLIVSFMGDDIIGSRTEKGKIQFLSKVFSKLNIYLASNFYNFTIVKSMEMSYHFKKVNNIKLEIIPNGVNLNIFKPADKNECRKKLNLPLDKILVLFSANPERLEKNYSLAQVSVECLTNEFDIQLVTEYKLSQLQLCDYFNAVDIMVLTSFHEGSPNVVKEAMACNLPVVTTHVGDVEWVIGPTKGCYIADFNESDFSQKLELAIRYVVQNNRTEGLDQLKRINLDSKSVAEKLIKIYENINKTNQ